MRLAHRVQDPKDPAEARLLFVTKYGLSWAKDTSTNPAQPGDGQVLALLFMSTVGKGLGFYTLRHTFRTIADEAKDQPAVDHVMGHARAMMASFYRESISDARLNAVADHVHAWLYAEEVKRAHKTSP